MLPIPARRPFVRRLLSSAAVVLALIGTAPGARAEVTTFLQTMAAAASSDQAVADWYRSTDYVPVWTGEADAERRTALFSALATAADHGLPPARYDLEGLQAAFGQVTTAEDLARLEVAMTRSYLTWADDLTSGMLEPKAIDSTIVRDIVHEDPQALMLAVTQGNPWQAMQDLLPQSNVYAQLVKAKIGLEIAMTEGGWGPVVPGGGALGPGAQGGRVVALRDRLIAMGYLHRSATQTYDRDIEAAVSAYQTENGLKVTGTAGAETIAHLNVPPEERMKSILVAMERERWMDIDRSGRIIWVNLPDFTAKILDDGVLTFSTRAVIGRQDMDRRTPEFSDEMNHMVVNPSWGVPRSIIVNEYLPLLQGNPHAVSHLQVIDSAGRVVPRGSVNFARFTARSFPYGLRQPPGDGNALGKVKFMFPNKYNIYLHDTPAKSLFSHDVRAYSHGCIRLADPIDFAHVLLSAQSHAVEEEFDGYLKSGLESPVKFERVIPVHLVYFTAYPEASGRIGYRADVYDRDAMLWDALAAAGVALPSVSQ